MRTQKPTVTIVLRDKRQGKFSIEQLFSHLVPEFEKQFEVKLLTLPFPPSTIKGIVRNILFVRKHAKGLIHITGDSHYIVPFLRRGSVLLTVHDLGRHKDLGGLKKRVYWLLWLFLPIKRALKVTTISEATKNEIIKVVHVDESNISVIPNCIRPGFCKKANFFNHAKPQILQIGSRPHKNLEGLLRAVVGLNCSVKVVGQICSRLADFAKSHQIELESETGVSDERLVEIYCESEILFFASIHEGFGLPIIEAQSVGIPVITSNCFSMPEVAGQGSAVLVDPYSPIEIREAIVRIVEFENFRKKMVERGYENAKRFSPERTAKNYIDEYKRLMG